MWDGVLERDRSPAGGVAAPFLERLSVVGGDLLDLGGDFEHFGVCQEREEGYFSVVETLFSLVEFEIEDSGESDRLAAAVGNRVYTFYGCGAGGDQFVDDHYLPAHLQVALDHVFEAMVFGLMSDISIREGERVGHDSTDSDGAGGDAGDLPFDLLQHRFFPSKVPLDEGQGLLGGAVGVIRR